MIPSLYTFSLIAAVVLVLVGLPFLLVPHRIEKAVRAFPRHRLAGVLTMMLGGGWFLFKISQLTQSDFGDYKNLLFLLFLATLMGSIFYVKDFLAVRGVSILILLSANTGLKSAFGLYDIPERLVLVTVLYLFILASIIYGIAPYHMRDSINALYRKPLYPRLLGIILVLMGSSVLIAAFNY
jgi:uncharacterized protein YjeT (DUF2065 family)